MNGKLLCAAYMSIFLCIHTRLLEASIVIAGPRASNSPHSPTNVGLRNLDCVQLSRKLCVCLTLSSCSFYTTHGDLCARAYRHLLRRTCAWNHRLTDSSPLFHYKKKKKKEKNKIKKTPFTFKNTLIYQSIAAKPVYRLLLNSFQLLCVYSPVYRILVLIIITHLLYCGSVDLKGSKKISGLILQKY